MMRDYEYLQQRAYVRVDLLEKRLVGISEVVLAPKASVLKLVRLHARQLRVQRVQVNGHDASFEQLDFLSEVVEEAYRDLATFDLFYRGAIVASKEGELIVQLPRDVQIVPVADKDKRGDKPPRHGKKKAKRKKSRDGSIDEGEIEEGYERDDDEDAMDTDTETPQDEDETMTDEEEGAWDIEQIPRSTTDFQPLVVRIEYVIEDPKGGVRFVLPNESQPTRSPHMYTYSGPFGGLCDGARTWMPCRDVLRDTCPFRIELTVPDWCVAICSGKLVEQCVSPDGNDRTFRYVVNTKTNCSSIGFAVGPFRLYVPPEMPRMSHFALPESFADLMYATSKLAATMSYFEEYLNASYPFQSYQQVFVEDPPEQLQYFAGMSILDQHYLHGACIIDRELPSHLAQVQAFVGSWVSGAVGIQTTKDAWVLIGIIGHLVNAYVRSVYGEEESGYRIQLAMDALTTMELTTDRPSPALVSNEVDVFAEYDPSTLPFLEVKAPLILHMIEQRVNTKHLRIALQRALIPSASVSEAANGRDSEAKDDDAHSEEKKETDEESTTAESKATGKDPKADATSAASLGVGGGPLSTGSFLKTVKAIAGAPGQDLTKSFLTWIVEGGMPFFSVGYWYNRKQTQAEVVLQQEVPANGASGNGKLYTGPITITIVEDTSEYTYQKRIEQRRHKWDFPCHNKVRKKRRKRQGLDDPDDSVSVTGPGMGLNDTPVFWVKLDTGCAWLRHVVLHQPDFNWMEQLRSDKSVGSRVHAARALALYPRRHEKPNVMSCRVLTECMSGLTTHSRRLRAEAALSLGVWQSIHAPLTNVNTELPIWKAMHNLFRIFKEHFYDRTTDMPLPNYFLPSGGKVVLEALGAQHASISSKQIQVQDYAAGEYEIKKTIPRALAMVRAQNGRSPPEIETFLLQLPAENANSKNYVEMDDQSQVADDCFYLGSILVSLSRLSIDRSLNSTADIRVVQEILRYLHYDQVQPSFHNTITVCCLEALCNLMLAGRCSNDRVDFFAFASPLHNSLVRKAAVESIIRLFFAEDSNGPASMPATTSSGASRTQRAGPAGDSIANVYGPTAAMLWVTRFLQVEDSPGLRLFAVQVCLNCIHGFPPTVATEMLATSDHSHTLAKMKDVQLKDPTAFILSSPDKQQIRELFVTPSLHKLRDDSLSARRVAEELWKLMNTETAVDQRLRVALMVLYRKIWGDTTPIAVAHMVQEKPAHWAGGYESLRLLMEESKTRQLQAQTSANTTANAASGSSSSAPSSSSMSTEIGIKRSPAASNSSASISGSNSGIGNSDHAALEHLRGKKLKVKMGDVTLFRSQHL